MGIQGLVSELNSQFLIGFLAVLAVLFITYVVWKKPLIGGAGYFFLGFALIFAPYIFGQTKPPFNWITTIPALTGILFLIDGLAARNKVS